MQPLRTLTLAAALLAGLVSASLGQGPGPVPGSDGPRPDSGPPGFGPPGFGPPGFGTPGMGPRSASRSFALKDALDTDHDGKLSEAEIRTAADSLKKLDKNHDGKLNAEEIGWPLRFLGGPSGGGPPGGPPGGGRGMPFNGPPGGDRGQGGRSFAERLMNRDANHDGKVGQDELPKSMHWLIRLGDQDKDGAVDEKESRALAERLGLAASRPDSK